MPQTNLRKLLLNQEPESAPTVKDPAFSLTKVLATAATVLTPLTAFLAEQLGVITFTAGNVVALILGVLGFLAIATAADVVARSVASAAAAKADAMTSVAEAEAQRAKYRAQEAALVAAPPAPPTGYKGMLTFDPPMPGRLTANAGNLLKVHALAEVEGAPHFLCSVKGEKTARWLARAEVTFSLPSQRPAQGTSSNGATSGGPTVREGANQSS